MPIASLLGGMIGQGGAASGGGAAGQAGTQAYQNAQTERARNWANTSPWVSVGSEASNRLAQAYGLGHLDGGAGDPTFGGQSLVKSDLAGDRANALRDFQASPGYNWRVGEGVKALDRSAASRGMALSGQQQRAVTDYGQSKGADEWGNYITGLGALSGGGMNAALGTGNTNANIFNAGNALQFQGATNRASAFGNAANALAGGIGSGTNSLMSLFGRYGGSLFGGGASGSADGALSGGGALSSGIGGLDSYFGAASTAASAV